MPTKTSTKRYVKVDFLNTGHYGSTGKGYFYRDTFKRPLEEFEVVLAPTRYGYQIAVVKEVIANATTVPYSSGCIKTVAERLKSKVIEKELRAERAKVVEKKLEAKIKEMDKFKVFESYAKEDPEVAELVKQLKELK